MRIKPILIVTAMLLMSTLVWAKDGEGPSKEQREKMAANHEKMSACLRSDKPLKDCHDEMRKSCEENKGSCPMREKMMERRGRRDMGKGMRRGMNQDSE